MGSLSEVWQSRINLSFVLFVILSVGLVLLFVSPAMNFELEGAENHMICVNNPPLYIGVFAAVYNLTNALFCFVVFAAPLYLLWGHDDPERQKFIFDSTCWIAIYALSTLILVILIMAKIRGVGSVIYAFGSLSLIMQFKPIELKERILMTFFGDAK